MNPTVAAIPEIAGPTPAATKKPSTLRRLSSLKSLPKWRLISHATNRDSPALHRAKTRPAARFRSPEKTCGDGGGHYSKDYRQPRSGPKCNECSRGDTRSRPEHGHAIGLCQQSQTQLSDEKVSNSDGDGEPNWTKQRRPPRTMAGRRTVSGVLQQFLHLLCSLSTQQVVAAAC